MIKLAVGIARVIAVLALATVAIHISENAITSIDKIAVLYLVAIFMPVWNKESR